MARTMRCELASIALMAFRVFSLVPGSALKPIEGRFQIAARQAA